MQQIESIGQIAQWREVAPEGDAGALVQRKRQNRQRDQNETEGVFEPAPALEPKAIEPAGDGMGAEFDNADNSEREYRSEKETDPARVQPADRQCTPGQPNDAASKEPE